MLMKANGNDMSPPVLNNVRIIELAAIGPAPFCGMMLADHGADVIRIDRPGGSDPLAQDQGRDVMLRSRRSITLNLKDSADVEIVKQLASTADGIIEGYRPGVAERLGLGPAVLMERNPALVYGRMTGWGQNGPYSARAGHDINYLSLNGCLALMGEEGKPPVPPLNLIGDYGGGGMMLAFGIVSALLSARATGIGRIIDCSMAEGASLLMAGMWSLRHNNMWGDERGRNLLDGGAPFYGCFQTLDGKYISIGAVEAVFYKRFIDTLKLDSDPLFAEQLNQQAWPAMKTRIGEIFMSKTQSEWVDIFAHVDCCFTEILSMEGARAHEHNIERQNFQNIDGFIQPKPAPNFSNSKNLEKSMWKENSHREELLKEIRVSSAQI